jgi:hypothetical protein
MGGFSAYLPIFMNPYGIVYALIALIVWIIGYLVLVFILKKLGK